MREYPGLAFSTPAMAGFLDAAVAIDLEVHPATGRILKIGALDLARGDDLRIEGRFNEAEALGRLDRFCRGADLLVGHNLARHDLPIVQEKQPRLALVNLPLLDTLWLSPLAFPRNPYHRLAKPYQISKDSAGDPVRDARQCGELLGDEWEAFSRLPAGVLGLFGMLLHWQRPGDAYAAFFRRIAGTGLPERSRLEELAQRRLEGKACPRALASVCERTEQGRVEPAALAYCLAWLQVAGESSVCPVWVRRNFSEVPGLLEELRGRPCGDPSCRFCRELHDPEKALKRYFGYDRFLPVAGESPPLQEAVVSAILRGENCLAVMPTGGGKSLCYQLPALMRSEARSRLTVILSPLQSLMKDQVDGMLRRGATNAATINGLLTMPERSQALDAVRTGSADVLFIAPEQLRNRTVRRTLDQRELAMVVFDEAHCLSRWGHDFRPDYLHVSRVLRERAERLGEPAPQIACFTATATPDVVEDVRAHFLESLGADLSLFMGGHERGNLDFQVVPVTQADKADVLMAVVEDGLQEPGGVVVFLATRKRCEEVSGLMRRQGWEADFFHGGRTPEQKRAVQEAFLRGELRVIAATNAFGMGVDKPDIRLVVHADPPGSLESYLQEAGRAGRDRKPARCVLLYDPEDLETQFSLAGSSRLEFTDLRKLHAGLKRLTARKEDHAVVLTSGELLRADEMRAQQLESFDLAEHDYDTRVKIAVSWLERSGRLQRDDNRTRVVGGKVLVLPEELDKRLAKLSLPPEREQHWRRLLACLLQRGARDMVNTDWLCAETGLEAPELFEVLDDMRREGIVTHDLSMTAYVCKGVADSSKARLAERQSWERALLDWMEEQSPDAGPDEPREINLRAACQELRDRGENGCTPQEIRLIFKLHAQAALLRWRKRGDNRYALSFSVDWAELRRRVEQRRLVCRVLLDELVRRVPKGRQGKDILVSFQKGDLERALRDDLQTRELPGVSRLIEQGLLALHELNAVTLQNGLSVFRAAMTLRVRPDGERFKKEEFRPLEEFFERKIVQVHIMSRFAELAADAVKAALVLVRDYFLHPGAQFLARHFQGQEWMLKLPTTAQSYARIVDSLDPVQREAVEAGDDNVLINAGPGSGKTRVVVRRIAWLVRVRRVSPRSILALAFNRSAAGQIRKRLRELIGGDAGWVRVSTYHALAMSITGRTLMGRRPQAGDEFFTGVLEEAVQLMEKAAQGGGELVDWRDRLLSGLRYILVDEYQDVNELEYRFLSLLAGRTEDRERRPALMAVGDDDQNIYAWAGANAAFIRRFEADYGARVLWLTRNHRSAPAVVDAANRLIRSNRGRMKTGRDMASAAFGGSPGRVRFFLARDEASMLKTALELAREAVDSGVPPEGVCVLCRTNRELDALERLAGAMGLPAKPIRARREPLTSTREFLLLKACLEACGRIRLRGNRLQSLVHELVRDSGYRSDNPWMGRVLMLLDLYLAETGGGARRVQDFLLFLYDASRELAREARPEAGLIGLMTMHSAKGLEFEAVVAAGQPRTPRSQDLDDERRLFYVAATRARERLDVLARRDAPHPFQEEMAGDSPPIPAHARLNEAETTAYATRWLELGLADVVISWPALEGVCARAQPVLARLEPGDRQGLAICRQGRNWLIQAWETPVAKLSQAGAGRLRTLMDDGYVPLGVEHTAGVVWEAREQDGEADVRPPAMERWLVGLFRIELRRPTA